MNYQRGQGYQQPRHTYGAGNSGRAETTFSGYPSYYPGSPTYGQQGQSFGASPGLNTGYRPQSTRMIIENEGRFQPIGTTNTSQQPGFGYSSNMRQATQPQYNYNYPSSRPVELPSNTSQRASQYGYPNNYAGNTTFDLQGPRYSESRQSGRMQEPQQAFGQNRGYDQSSQLFRRAQSPDLMVRQRREQPQQNYGARPLSTMRQTQIGGGRGSGPIGIATLTYTDQFGNVHQETRELGSGTFGQGQRSGRQRGGGQDIIPAIESEMTALLGAMFGGGLASLLGGGMMGSMFGGMGGMGGFGGFGRSPLAMMDEIMIPRMIGLLMMQELQSEPQTRGLAPEELNNIPVSQFKAREVHARSIVQSQNNPAATSDKACTICLTDFQEAELLRTMKCTHKFHKNCIDQWLVRNGSCPICRESAT